MKKHVVSKENQIKSILFITVLMLITIYAILKGYSIHEIIAVIKQVHPFYLLAGIGMMVLYFACQALNFKMILSVLSETKSYRSCMEYAYIGYYFGSITPAASGSQPAQMYYMNKDRVPLDFSSIMIFFMVFVSQITLILLAGLLTVFRLSFATLFEARLKYLLLSGTIVTVGLTLILFAVMFSRKTVPFFLSLFVKVGTKLHLIKKPEEMKIKLNQLVISYRDKATIIKQHPLLFVKVLIITFMEWSLFCSVSYLVYLGFGYRQYGLLDLMTSQSLLNIAVTAVPLPGSVGVAEKAFMDIFGEYYPSDILPSAMILSRIINFYLPLFISFIVYLFAHIRIIKQAKKNEQLQSRED
ncbi:MAG TPA: lysylphosphatidylglycerol synthase transmembrane domain-containing protein [Mobilitalea sp.]|nr:lysylphosphatidylglycerol synthase transmembrane domain-containing protein [Mobilitalea sp.]